MEQEFNLSEKKILSNDEPIRYIYIEEDVKEFIRLLKEEMKTGLIADKRYNGIRLRIEYIINKLTGEKLI